MGSTFSGLQGSSPNTSAPPSREISVSGPELQLLRNLHQCISFMTQILPWSPEKRVSHPPNPSQHTCKTNQVTLFPEPKSLEKRSLKRELIHAEPLF